MSNINIRNKSSLAKWDGVVRDDMQSPMGLWRVTGARKRVVGYVGFATAQSAADAISSGKRQSINRCTTWTAERIRDAD